MSQDEIDRAVSEVTGESLGTVRRRGFSLVTSCDPAVPDEPFAQPQVVDWDGLARDRCARAA